MIKKSFFLSVLVTVSCIPASTYSMGTNPFKPIWSGASYGLSYIGQKSRSGISYVKQKFSKQQSSQQSISQTTTNAETERKTAVEEQSQPGVFNTMRLTVDTARLTAEHANKAVTQGTDLVNQIKSPETHAELRTTVQSVTQCVKELSDAATPLVKELNKLMGTNGSPQSSSPMPTSPRSEIETKHEDARRHEDTPQIIANDSAKKQADLRNILADTTGTLQAGTQFANAANPVVKDLHSILKEGPSSRAILKCVAGVSAIFGLGLMGMHYGAGKLAQQAPKFKFGAVALLGGISYLVGDGIVSSLWRKQTTPPATA